VPASRAHVALGKANNVLRLPETSSAVRVASHASAEMPSNNLMRSILNRRTSNTQQLVSRLNAHWQQFCVAETPAREVLRSRRPSCCSILLAHCQSTHHSFAHLSPIPAVQYEAEGGAHGPSTFSYMFVARFLERWAEAGWDKGFINKVAACSTACSWTRLVVASAMMECPQLICRWIARTLSGCLQARSHDLHLTPSSCANILQINYATFCV
jgi:hypothetical protein